MDNLHSDKKHKFTKRKFFILSALASFLLVAAISITTVYSRHNAAAHAVVKCTCAATLYPELCVSTVTAAAAAIKTCKDVLIAALNYTIFTVE
ncbi:hypothetical protein ACS0TY_019380 [Phlomoides rotata]